MTKLIFFKCRGLLPAMILLFCLQNAQAEVLQVTDRNNAVFLEATQTTAELWVKVNNIALVVTGSYVNVSSPDGSNTSGDLVCSASTSLCAVTLDVFNKPGTYQINYLVFDVAATGYVPVKSSKVYKAKAGNSPPLPFISLAPSDGFTSGTVLRFDWETANDPDGDPLTYTFLLSSAEGTNFGSKELYREEGLSAPMLYLSDAAVIKDGRSDGTTGLRSLTDYYWKVLAIDQYGAFVESEKLVNSATGITIVQSGSSHLFTDRGVNANLLIACQEQSTNCNDARMRELKPGEKMKINGVEVFGKWYAVELEYNGNLDFSLDTSTVTPYRSPDGKDITSLKEAARFFYDREGKGQVEIFEATVEGAGTYRARMCLVLASPAWGFSVTHLCPPSKIPGEMGSCEPIMPPPICP